MSALEALSDCYHHRHSVRKPAAWQVAFWIWASHRSAMTLLSIKEVQGWRFFPITIYWHRRPMKLFILNIGNTTFMLFTGISFQTPERVWVCRDAIEPAGLSSGVENEVHCFKLKPICFCFVFEWSFWNQSWINCFLRLGSLYISGLGNPR